MATLPHGLIAVVPARGGSRRIPRKNIRPFLGVPLLTRIIGILQATQLFDRIVVSTDDAEIAELATSAGAEVPFLRPASLSDDVVGIAAVMAHAVREVERTGARFDSVCCAYATAVLSIEDDYVRAARMLAAGGTDYVVSCAQFGYPIQRALRAVDGGIAMFHPEHRLTRSQDLEPAFHDAGQFYFGTREAWLQERPLFAAASRMLVLPRHRVQDIDTHEDWTAAEWMFRTLSHHTERVA